MNYHPEAISNVYGGARAGKKPRTREKTIHGVKLDLADDPHSKGQSAGHGQEGEGTWIYSFADLIMNLLMFFVMMFAISSVDKDKLAIVRSAIVSYSDAEPVDSKREVSSAGASGLSFGSEGQRPEAVMNRVKELLAGIDVSKLKAQAALAKDFNALKSQIVDLESLVGAHTVPDQDEEAFQIVLARERVFGSSPTGSEISQDGEKILKRLAGELSRIKKPLRISVLGNVSSTASGDAWAEASLRAARVAAALKRGGLSAEHLLSAGGVEATGATATTEPLPHWNDAVILYVGLLRQKPDIHRGKDRIK